MPESELRARRKRAGEMIGGAAFLVAALIAPNAVETANPAAIMAATILAFLAILGFAVAAWNLPRDAALDQKGARDE